VGIFPAGGTVFTSPDKQNSFFVTPASAPSLTTQQIVDLVKQYLAQQGITNISTTNAPVSAKIGTYTWTVDGNNTATQVNVPMRWTTYDMKTPSDFYIIVFALAPAATYATADGSFFQPMLASLHITI